MQAYYHRFYPNSLIQLTPGKIVCVGRNYYEHIAELNNPIPKTPLLFIKPTTAYSFLEQGITLPSYSNECHHEIEIAVLIGKPLKDADIRQIQDAILGYGIALDLTLRDIQQELKANGHPWELAKAFDNSCPISPLIPANEILNPQKIHFSLSVNDKLRQIGDSSDMITAIYPLIEYISRYFTLLPGDVVLTGTPSGVQALKKHDKLLINFNNHHFLSEVH